MGRMPMNASRGRGERGCCALGLSENDNDDDDDDDDDDNIDEDDDNLCLWKIILYDRGSRGVSCFRFA